MRRDHGAIFGVSTYVVVYATALAGLFPATAFAAGVLAATLVAAIFGLLAVRTSGVYFLLLTLALGMIIWGICLRWTQVTGDQRCTSRHSGNTQIPRCVRRRHAARPNRPSGRNASNTAIGPKITK